MCKATLWANSYKPALSESEFFWVALSQISIHFVHHICLVDKSAAVRSGMRHALSPWKSAGISPPPAPLEDSSAFYFEAYHAGRWHNPDHINVNLLDYIAYLRTRVLWHNVLTGWGKVRSTNRLCILYFSPWRKGSLSADDTHCTVTLHLRENCFPDSSFENINFYYLSVLVFQELWNCKY